MNGFFSTYWKHPLGGRRAPATIPPSRSSKKPRAGGSGSRTTSPPWA